MSATGAVMDAPTVLVTAVGRAEGSRGAAAALACAGADVDRASLLVDLGGRSPRPTLITSAAARTLEEQLAAHLPAARVAARGQVCHLAVAADSDGLDLVASAVTVARGALAVLHVPPEDVQALLDHNLGRRVTEALLRADLAVDKALLALVVSDVRRRGLRAGVLKQRLGWVAERRALFGVLTPGSPGGMPAPLLTRLLSHQCYGGPNDPRAESTRAAQPEWRDHASLGSR